MLRYLSILAIITTGLTLAAAERNIVENVDADGRSQLKISHGHGNITVEGWDQDRVSLKGTITTSGRWNKRIDELDVEVSTSGDTVTVRVIKPKANWSGSGSYRIDYELKAPRGMAVDLRNAHGHTTISDFQGDANLKNSHGNLEGSQFGGNLTLSSNHGRAEVSHVGGQAQVKHNHGNLTLNDVSGDLEYSGNHGRATLKDIRGSIEMKNSHGKVTVDGVDGGVEGSLSHSSLTLTTETIPDDHYIVKASHGNITLNLPEDAGLDLKVETRHGRIKSDTDLRVKKERNAASLKGKVRGGGVLVKLNASHGNVTINSI